VNQITLGRKILFSSVLCLAALLLCEAAIRVRAWIKYDSWQMNVRDPMIELDSTIGLFVARPGYESSNGHIKINSWGFRGDELTREKPPNTVRIAVLGASTTFNAEVTSNHATWPHRLQTKLRDAHPDVNVEVINASLGGYVAADNLKNLRHRVLPFNPDLVIYYEANNEIVRDTRERALELGLIESRERSRLVTALAHVSLMFDLAQKNLLILTQGWGGSKGKMDQIPADLPRRFISVLDEMRRELEQRNVPLMLSTFVVKFRRDQDRSTQIANADVAFYYMPWMSIDGLLAAMDTYNQSLLDYARGSGLRVVDDRHAIPADAEHFTDCMHLADKGAEAMAERFFRYFESEGIMASLGAATNRVGAP
jgi:GDSL-like Lipase/Acylhydrolase family